MPHKNCRKGSVISLWPPPSSADHDQAKNAKQKSAHSTHELHGPNELIYKMWVDGGSKISRLICLAADVKITNCRERRSRGCPEVQAVRMNYVNIHILYSHLYLLYEINIGQGVDPFRSSTYDDGRLPLAHQSPPSLLPSIL